MKVFEKFPFKNSKRAKILSIVLILFVILGIAISVPSLARFMNRSSLVDTVVWDGSVASSYRKGSGSKEDPYLIANGSELAYFAQNLENTDYQGVYFKLANDIVLNDGVFSYQKESGLSLLKDSEVKSVDLSTGSGLHLFPEMKNFKGYFDGDSYRIYGLLILNSASEEVGLFHNLEGTIENLYVENAFVYGGHTTALLAVHAKNAVVRNTMIQGSVVGLDGVETVTKDISTHDVVISQKEEEEDYEVLLPSLSFVPSKITLSGSVQIDGEGSASILGQEVTDSFQVEVDPSLEKILLHTIGSSDTKFQFTNLSFHVEGEVGDAAGLVYDASSLTIENVVVKGDITSTSSAAGFVHSLLGDSTLVNSYNTASIHSESATGLIHQVYGQTNLSISMSYNRGVLDSTKQYGFLGNVSLTDGEVKIQNSFNTTDNYFLGSVQGVVSLENVFTSSLGVLEGEIQGEVSIVPNVLEEVPNHISYPLYVDSSDYSKDHTHAWVMSDGYPILYLDDSTSSIATINVGNNYSWNNVGYKLNPVKFSSAFAFQIEEADHLNPIKEQYYYLSHSRDALTQEEITSIQDWTPYTDIVEIDQEGIYVIYVKVVDYYEQVSYLNTDLIILDMSGSDITISYQDHTWNALSLDVHSLYASDDIEVTIDAYDDLSGVDTIEYYLSSEVLTKDDLDQLDEKEWIPYQDPIVISEEEKIVYVKVKDNCRYVTYANTDFLSVNGYRMTRIQAGDQVGEDSISVTDHSTVEVRYQFKGKLTSEKAYTHVFRTSESFPVGTILTLIDQQNHKVYQRTIEEELTEIPFTSFHEIGKVSKNDYWVEEDGVIQEEDYTLLLDFQGVEEELSQVRITLELSLEDEILLTTLPNTYKSFTVYPDMDSSVSLQSDYTSTLTYNVDQVYSIPFSLKLLTKSVAGIPVYDTNFAGRMLGVAIRLVDSKGQPVSSKNLKNLVFQIDGKKYSPGNDGVVRCNLENGLQDSLKTLTIETYQDHSSLESGTYQLQIGGYAAFGGMYDQNISYDLSIPVLVSNKKSEYPNFAVSLSNDMRILEQGEVVTIPISVLMNTTLQKPSVKVALYQKVHPSAYQREYELIDLQDSLVGYLNRYQDSIYESGISTNRSGQQTFSINLDTSKLKKNAYQFAFMLYDGDTKVAVIHKDILIR